MVERSWPNITSMYIIGKCWLVVWFIGWLVIICRLKDTGPYWIMFANECGCKRWHDNASKDFEALLDNVCDCVCLLLQTFP
jgi:hypothetical protein